MLFAAWFSIPNVISLLFLKKRNLLIPNIDHVQEEVGGQTRVSKYGRILTRCITNRICVAINPTVVHTGQQLNSSSTTAQGQSGEPAVSSLSPNHCRFDDDPSLEDTMMIIAATKPHASSMFKGLVRKADPQF